MDDQEAIAHVERWLRDLNRGDLRGPYSVFSTHETSDGWIVGYTVVDDETGERIYENLSVDVHELGDITERLDGIAVAPPRWLAKADPELVLSDGVALGPAKSATTGWWRLEDGVPTGEFRRNPLHQPGPSASGTQVENDFEKLLAWKALGWIQENTVYERCLRLHVLVSEEPGEVFTSERFAPPGTALRTSPMCGLLGAHRPYGLYVNPGAELSLEMSTRVLARWLEGHRNHRDCLGPRPASRPVGPVDPARLRGSLLAGAVGDALGAPAENLPMEIVRERHGPDGVTDLVGDALITDDTQMTMFTLEAVIRAHHRVRLAGTTPLWLVFQHAYQRWLHTQGTPWEQARGFGVPHPEPSGWLVGHRDLFHKRAPGASCLTALRHYAEHGGGHDYDRPINDSKGCGAVMRAAPIALWSDDPAAVFEVAVTSALLTHGHPSGYLSAGTLAVLVQQLVRGVALPDAVETAISELVAWPEHEEQLAALRSALALAAQGSPTPAKVEQLGSGGTGESALAIALYAAVVTGDPNDALLVAVNHGGDSDSTGSVCGNIVGALHGVDAIRRDWLDRVQFGDVIEQLVADALTEFGDEPPAWGTRYPPS